MKEMGDVSGITAEVIKENPMIFSFVIVLIILAIIIFYFKIPEEDHYDESTISHTWPLGGGFGIGPELEKGETIEVEYEVLDGEAVDVYLYKQNFSSIEIRPYDDEEIIHKENTYSGYFSYEADEHGIYMVFFEGPNYTVHYTIDVIEPGPTIKEANLALDLLGLFLLILIIPLIWVYFNVKNPKYISNNLTILPLSLIVFGAFIYINNDISQRMEPDVPLFIFVITMGIIFYINLAGYFGHYRLMTRDKYKDVANRIEEYLIKREIPYTSGSNVREHFLKWNFRIHLTDDDLSIKLMHQQYQQWRTAIFIGKQNTKNKKQLKKLVNEIAQELNVENLKTL